MKIDWTNLALRIMPCWGSQKAVAEKYGCTNKAVSKQMVKRGIPVNRIDWSNLEADYRELGTQAAVAEKVWLRQQHGKHNDEVDEHNGKSL